VKTTNAKRTWIALLALGSLVMTSVAAQAGRPRPPGLEHLERRIESLGLADDVRQQALAIVDEARPGERELRDRIHDAHEQLRALLEADTPDPAAIDAQVDALGALRTQMQKQFLATLLGVGALLDGEQRSALLAPPDRGGPRGRWLR